MKLLLLLTAQYPYGSGEDFLSAEVNYIQGFDRVLVCPCNRKADSVVTKKVPQGFSVVPIRKTDPGKSVYAKLMTRSYVLDEIASLLCTGRCSAGRVHEMLFFMKNAVALFTALKEIPELKTADEVVIYSYWFYDAAAAGVLLAGELRSRGIKVRQYSRAHGFDVYPERSPNGYLPMRKFLLQRVDGVFPCSQNGSDTIQRQFPSCSSKVRPAFLGTADHGVRGGSRKGGFRLVTCSYMVPVKRLHLIVQALEQADFPVFWTHIGSGPLEQEILRQTANLPENVHTEFTGQLDNSAIMGYYRTTDVTVFVNVSSSEGIPVSVMEACSFGIPVVATDVGGNSEAVRDGQNGFLLKKDFHPADLLEKFRLLRDLPERDYGRLCDSSRKIWEEKFNAAQNYRKFYEVIG